MKSLRNGIADNLHMLHSKLSANQRRALKLIRETINSFFRIDAIGLSKQVAFSVMFAVLPALFVIVSISALIEHYLHVPVTEELREFIVQEAPIEAQTMLLNGVDQAIQSASTQFASIAALVSLLLTLWAGTSGINALVEATNRAYGVRNTRSFVRKRLMALGMTLLFTGMVVLTVAFSFFSQRIIEALSNATDQRQFFTEFGQLTQTMISIAITFLVLFLLYLVGPNVELTAKMLIPGTVVGTFSWILLLRLFGIIAARVPYQNIYGAAGTAIVLLYFLNIAGIGLILGAVVNGVVGHDFDKRRAADLAAHPEKLRYIEEYREQYSDAV